MLIYRDVKDRDGEAGILNNLGSAYLHLSQYAKSVEFFQQALLIEREVKNRDGEAAVLGNLMDSWKSLNKSGLAVFYGKQAINTLQSIRQNIAAMDKDSQKRYLEAKTGTYRFLADLLISQGRLPEAQQVLKMLKEREFYDYLHSDSQAPSPTMDELPYTPREDRWNTRYEEAAKPLSELGGQEQTLLAVKQRSPAQDTELTSLQVRLRTASDAMLQVQKLTVADFTGSVTAEDTPPKLTATQDLQKALPPGTVALYTIVAPDRLNLILVTSSGQKAHTSAITADALYQSVQALRRALTDPDLDPTGPAAVLYHLILEPVQKDLDAAGAKTILFSLDDALRYIPPAVLYNPRTKEYVAERYRTELITLAGTRPAAVASSKLTVLGLGVSKSQDGAPALPGVTTELEAIVYQPGDVGGLVPGRRLLDSQFTRTALEDALKTADHPLVHLASHFALHGTQDTSYLLLGDGSHLTVADLAKDPHRFQGVELLTLSACQTAMEVRGSTGREVEGVGVLAQTLGAGSVLASLWPVSDAATPPLMTALYGYRQRHPAASLAEALQAAQLDLLHKPMPASADTIHRGTEAVLSSGDSGDLPSFHPDSKAPYAHPFYWAPFILIGSWR